MMNSEDTPTALYITNTLATMLCDTRAGVHGEVKRSELPRLLLEV
jgi:hypothetical protein